MSICANLGASGIGVMSRNEKRNKVSDDHRIACRSELRVGQGSPAADGSGSRPDPFPTPDFSSKRVGGVGSTEGDQPSPSFRLFLKPPAIPPALL